MWPGTGDGAVSAIHDSTASAQIPDAELMTRFRDHWDEQSFEDLAKRHYIAALAVAENRLGDPGLAQDAVQETLIRVAKERRRYDVLQPFAPWFYAILRNVCTDLQRKNSRYRGKLQGLAERQDEEPSRAPSYCTESVPEALEALSGADREILLLRLGEGMSFQDIADHLVCNLETAKKRAQRALARLRAKLAEK